MDITIKDTEKVSPFFAFFLIHSVQIGVGILGFQRVIVKNAGYDAWMSIILAGIANQVILWLMYELLKRGNGDLIYIHRKIFGKWIGGFLSTLFILYVLLAATVFLRSFTQVVQVWVFPQLSTWIFCAVLLLLACYYIVGGFRTVAGLCFLSVIYSLPLLIVLYFPLHYAHFYNFFPLMTHSPMQILLSAKATTMEFLGVELLLLFYPFLKEPDKSRRWGHYALLYTTIFYIAFAIVAFVYFTEDQLKSTIWATLSLWKIVEFPIVERFEYIGIAIWVAVVVPNLCICLWAANYGMKRIFSFKRRRVLPILALIVLLSCSLLTNHPHIDKLNTVFSEIGFYFLYTYIPFLFFVQLILYKVKGQQR